MTTLTHVSASTLRKYLECPRAATLEAMGLRRPYAHYLQRGHALHTAAEEWLTGQRRFPTDPLLIQAIEGGHLPEPNTPGVYVEIGVGLPNTDEERYAQTAHFTGLHETLNGIPVRGIADLVRTDRGVLEVWDHKTTKSFWWAERDSTIGANLQLSLYAYHFARWLDYTGPVVLGHIQYRKTDTPGPDDVRRVSATVHTEELALRWGILGQITEAFRQDVERASIPETEAYGWSCDAYGGCHLRTLCDTSPPQMQTNAHDRLRRMWAMAAEDWTCALTVY